MQDKAIFFGHFAVIAASFGGLRNKKKS